MIDVHRPLSAIGDKLIHDADGAVLMLLPLTSRRPRVLVPVGSAEQVSETVAIHIHGGDCFGMVGAQPMHEKRGLRNSIWAIAGGGLADALRVRRQRE